MHPHEARYGVTVRGVRNQAPCGPKADEQNVVGYFKGKPMHVISGGAPLATESELIDLRKEITAKEEEAREKRAAADKLVEDIRGAGTDPLRDKDAFTKVDEAYKESDGLKQEASELRERADRVMELLARENGSKPKDPNASRQTSRDENVPIYRLMGNRFMESESYKEAKEAGIFASGSSRVQLPPVEVMSRDELIDSGIRLRATVSWPAAVPVDQKPGIVDFPVRMIRVLDLITRGETDSDTVEYVEETTRTDVAAETPYGTDAPEATYVYTKRTASVKRIPQFTPATKGNLADAGQLRTLIGQRLGSGVERRLETQAVQGDGAGDNLTGILNAAGIGSQDRSTDSQLDALHKAITVVRLALFDEPDGIGLNPGDYDELVRGKDSTGNYLLGSPATQTVRTIWGFGAAVTTAFPADTAVVANFAEAATLWLRSGLEVTSTDSHADFFRKGLVAFLAELRAAFATVQPKAVCEVINFSL